MGYDPGGVEVIGGGTESRLNCPMYVIVAS